MDPVTLAVVGCGFGRHIVEALGRDGSDVRLVGVCDLDRELAERVAAPHGLHVYQDLDAVLADPSVEAVGLFTGPSGRAGLLGQVLAAGKHVMTTKPFELDPAAATRATAAARAAGLVLHANSPSPTPTQDIALIQGWAERLGAPVGASARTWAAYQESADGTWLDDPERCPVAPVLRLGVYLVNDLVRLFGPAESVQVTESRLRTGRPTPDSGLLSVRFANGALASVFVSFCVDDGRRYPDILELSFEHGSIRRITERDPHDPLTEPVTRLQLTTKGPDGLTVQEEASVVGVSGDYQWHEFALAVRDGADSSVPAVLAPVDGVAVLAAMARASRSGRTEAVVR